MSKRKDDCTPEEWEEYKKKQREKAKKYRNNMSDERKQHIKDYNKQYYKKHSIEIKQRVKERKDKLRKDKLILKTDKEKSLKDRVYYKTYASRLTVDEQPIPDDNGILMVIDFHTKEYFYPTKNAVENRIKAINGKIRGECHLYSSEENKKSCPVYGVKHYNVQKDNIKQNRIDAFWRNQVISRANGHCERCGKSSDVLHAHHIAPRATCAFDGDIDNGMALCPECHREVHSTDGCRLHELAAEKREAV